MRVFTDEQRKKISESLRNRTPWNKGKKLHYSPFGGRKHTDASKSKTSETLKRIGHKPQNSANWRVANLGVPHSEETKNKIRERAIGRKQSPYAREVAIKTLRENRWKVKALKGVDSPLWRGGVTPLRKQIWSSKKTKEWRNLVFQRDSYACIFCGKIGGKLEVDHIVPFSYILKKFNIMTLAEAYSCNDLWDINNGRTLCKECHKLTDTYMYRAKKYVEKKCTQ